MKLKNIFIALASSLCVLAACEKEEATSLESIQLDKTYLSIPASGGDAVLTVKANEAWAFAKDILIDKDNKVYGELPAWLTASTLSGGAGESKVTFHADAIDGGREQELHILVGSGDSQMTQYVIVRQGSLAAVKATCKEVIDGAEGKTYTVSGIVTNIENTTYGNWWLVDDTGEVYIYGTLDKDGKEKNFSSLGIENGDEITVQGPKTVYGDKIELVNVTVLKLTKSLIKVDVEEVSAPIEGKEFTVKAAYKGNGVFINLADDWVALKSMDYVKGVASKINPNPADTAVVKFSVLPNSGAARETSVELSSGSSSSTIAVKQEGLDLTISDVLKAEQGALVTTKPSLVVAKTTKGFVLSDGTKAVYVYDSGANAVAVGDNVIVKGSKTVYNGVHEIEKVSGVEVKESGKTVSYPSPRVIAGDAEAFTAAEAEFITFFGKLVVSGNYINVELEGIDKAKRQGSVVYPVDDLKAKDFAGKDVVITGYYNGFSGGKYINIIAVEIKEYTPGAKGTFANPYLPSEIAPILGAGTKITDRVFVKGKVSKIASQFSTQYGNSQFWISDDGAFKNDSEKDFEAYNVWYLGNKYWAEGNSTVKEGDEVVLFGEVTYYAKNKVAETNGKKAYMYSLNGKTE